MKWKSSFTKQHKSRCFYISCMYVTDVEERYKTLETRMLSPTKFVRSMGYFHPTHMSINQEQDRRFPRLDSIKHISAKKRHMKKTDTDD